MLNVTAICLYLALYCTVGTEGVFTCTRKEGEIRGCKYCAECVLYCMLFLLHHVYVRSRYSVVAFCGVVYHCPCNFTTVYCRHNNNNDLLKIIFRAIFFQSIQFKCKILDCTVIM